MQRATILAQLFRVGNSALLGALAVFSIDEPRIGYEWSILDQVLLFVSWTTLAATAYAVNDLVDRVRDRVNRPHRYLQKVDRTPLWLIASVAFAGGVAVLTGAFVPLDNFLAVEIVWASCAIGYSFGLKQRSGLLANLLTAFCVATSAAPGLLQGAAPRLLSLLPVLFLVMLAREIWKDIEDEPGDIIARLRTLPILRGKKVAARSASVIDAAACVALLLGSRVGLAPEMISACLAAVGLGASAWLFVQPDRLPAHRVQKLHRYAAILVFFVFVAGSML
ncbi:MAG: UbiA family prenyltransferase [Acidobacteria bacterium]|nr:UbiA family prenyltransferase [Acidobacteriota bacterium]